MKALSCGGPSADSFLALRAELGQTAQLPLDDLSRPAGWT